MIGKLEKYRKAAEARRRTAKRSLTPVEWLGFAADWDNMAAQAEKLSAHESEFMVSCFIANAMQALPLAPESSLNRH